jgi:hypothetical protein
MAADVEDSARMGIAKVATKKRGGSGKSHGGVDGFRVTRTQGTMRWTQRFECRG